MKALCKRPARRAPVTSETISRSKRVRPLPNAIELREGGQQSLAGGAGSRLALQRLQIREQEFAFALIFDARRKFKRLLAMRRGCRRVVCEMIRSGEGFVGVTEIKRRQFVAVGKAKARVPERLGCIVQQNLYARGLPEADR